MLAGFGACVAAVNLAYYVAIDHLPVGVAVALQYTGPAILLAATAVALRGVEPAPGRLAWVAAGLTLAGAVLVSQALEGLGGLDLPGLAAGLASAVLFAAYLLSAELAGRKGAEPATTLLWGFLVAVAIWAVAAPWWSWPVATLADPGVAAAVLGVGLVGTLLPFALAVGAVRVISAATAGIAATAEPVFAAAFAWLLLGQTSTRPSSPGPPWSSPASSWPSWPPPGPGRPAERREDVAGEQGDGQAEERHRRHGREPGLPARPDHPPGAGHGRAITASRPEATRNQVAVNSTTPAGPAELLGRQHRRCPRGQPERPGEGVGQVAGDPLPERPAAVGKLAVPRQGHRVAGRLPGQVEEEHTGRPHPQRRPVQRADDPGEGEGGTSRTRSAVADPRMTRQAAPNPLVAACCTMTTKMGPTDSAAPTPSRIPSHSTSITPVMVVVGDGD